MKKPDKKLLLIALIIIMGILCVISIVGKMSDQKESGFVLQEKQTWIKELGLEEIPEEMPQESTRTDESGETVQIEETEESKDVIILKLADEEELQIRKDEIIRTGDEEESAGVYDSAAYHVILKDGAAKVYRNQQEETAVSGYAAVRPDEKEGDDAE